MKADAAHSGGAVSWEPGTDVVSAFVTVGQKYLQVTYQYNPIRYLPSLQIQLHCVQCFQQDEDVNKLLLDCRLGPTLSCLVAKKR